MGHRARDQGDRLIDVERLRQVLVRTALIGGYRAVEIGVAGHDDHREMRIAGRDLAEEFQSVHIGHADVGDDRVGLAQPQPCVHAVSSIEPFDGEYGPPQRALEHPPDRLVIVDDPDLAHAAHRSPPPSADSMDSIGSRMLNVVCPGRLVHSMIPPCS